MEKDSIKSSRVANGGDGLRGARERAGARGRPPGQEGGLNPEVKVESSIHSPRRGEGWVGGWVGGWRGGDVAKKRVRRGCGVVSGGSTRPKAAAEEAAGPGPLAHVGTQGNRLREWKQGQLRGGSGRARAPLRGICLFPGRILLALLRRRARPEPRMSPRPRHQVLSVEHQQMICPSP